MPAHSTYKIVEGRIVESPRLDRSRSYADCSYAHAQVEHRRVRFQGDPLDVDADVVIRYDAKHLFWTEAAEAPARDLLVVPATLTRLVFVDTDRPEVQRVLLVNGRLTRERFTKVADKVDELFDAPVASLVRFFRKRETLIFHGRVNNEARPEDEVESPGNGVQEGEGLQLPEHG